jgi:hypothetical protein
MPTMSAGARVNPILARLIVALERGSAVSAYGVPAGCAADRVFIEFADSVAGKAAPVLGEHLVSGS